MQKGRAPHQPNAVMGLPPAAGLPLLAGLCPASRAATTMHQLPLLLAQNAQDNTTERLG